MLSWEYREIFKTSFFIETWYNVIYPPAFQNGNKSNIRFLILLLWFTGQEDRRSLSDNHSNLYTNMEQVRTEGLFHTCFIENLEYFTKILKDLAKFSGQPVFLEAVTRRCSVKMVFLEILQNSQENTCAGVSFLIKLRARGLRKRLWHRCFPVNFAKFLRTPLIIEQLWWLLPYFYRIIYW